MITATKSRYHSADQLAAAFVVGAALGLTPLLSSHNLAFLAAPIVLHLSISTFLLGCIGGKMCQTKARSAHSNAAPGVCLWMHVLISCVPVGTGVRRSRPLLGATRSGRGI